MPGSSGWKPARTCNSFSDREISLMPGLGVGSLVINLNSEMDRARVGAKENAGLLRMEACAHVQFFFRSENFADAGFGCGKFGHKLKLRNGSRAGGRQGKCRAPQDGSLRARAILF